MANLYSIEKEYKEVLLELKPNEVEAYIEAINKKLIETYPTATSDVFNFEQYKKLNKNLEEVTSFLKSKYPNVVAFEYGSKFNELNKKYSFETERAFYLLFRNEIAYYVEMIGRIIADVKYLFSSMYRYYNYMLHMRTELLKEEVGFSEEDLEPFNDIIYNRNATNFHGNKALSIVNNFIELEFEELEKFISKFTTYPKVIYDETTSEEVKKIIDSYNNIRNEGYNYIKKVEEIKANPFKEAIEIMAEVETKGSSSWTTDLEAYYNSRINWHKEYAPSYNFETFEIVLPSAKDKGAVTND